MKAEHIQHDTQGHEQKLASALGVLVEQVDIGEYRDRQGRDLKSSTAFLHAQAITDEFGVSHEDICKVLDSCGADYAQGANELRKVASANAASGILPEEPGSWVANP